MRQTDPLRDSQLKPIRQRLAWLPIPVFLVAIVVLWAVGTEAPHESVEVAIVLNLVFSVMVSLVVASLIGRTVLRRGTPGMLLLGCGIVIWGVAAVVAFAATQAGAPPIVIHNTCVFLAAVCHVIGAWLLLKDRPGLRSAGLWLGAGYTMALGVVAIVTLAGLAGRLPTFFIPGQGGTPLRHVVLGLSIAMFLVTAYLLRKAIPASRSPFAYWYTLALGLIAVGLFGVMIQPARGSLLGWAGRSAQLLSGVYMLVAAVASVRETGAWMLPLEAALRQSEERYRALFRSVSEACVIKEAIRDRAGTIIDFRFLEVNPAFEAQTGLSGVAGKTMREVMPNIEPAWIENYAKVARTGEPMRFQQRAAALGRWFDVFASRVGESESARVAILFNDITERKRAEDAVREARDMLEQRVAERTGELRRAVDDLQRTTQILRAISQYSPDLIFAKDCECRLVYASESTLRTLGKSAEEVMGRTDAESHADPRLGAAVMEHDRIVRETRQPLVIEEPTRLPDGTLRIFHSTKVPWLADDGTLLGTLGIAVDITEHKRVQATLQDLNETLEQQVAERTGALRRSEEGERQRAAELQAMLETAPIAMWIAHDPECRRITGNAAADRLLQVPRSANISASASPTEAAVTYKVFRGEVELPPGQMPAQLAVATGRPVMGEELELVFADGRRIHLIESAVPLFHADGRVRGAIIAGQDITARKQAEEALRASNQELEAFNRAMVGRELRMIELKQEINAVCAKLGQPPRYPLEDEEGQP